MDSNSNSQNSQPQNRPRSRSNVALPISDEEELLLDESDLGEKTSILSLFDYEAAQNELLGCLIDDGMEEDSDRPENRSKTISSDKSAGAGTTSSKSTVPESNVAGPSNSNTLGMDDTDMVDSPSPSTPTREVTNCLAEAYELAFKNAFKKRWSGLISMGPDQLKKRFGLLKQLKKNDC